jgi:cardiolipin synthase
MNWKLAALIIYLVALLLVLLRILYETRSATKTMAYILLVVFIPVFGMLFYLAFGVNYWRNRLYHKKKGQNTLLMRQLKNEILSYNESTLKKEDLEQQENAELASMILKDIESPLTQYNKLKLLINGEEKFPEIIQAMEAAEHHIHIEYYIFEQDETGMAVMDLLERKARKGVQVRFIYDDFGSQGIRKKTEKKLRAAGVEIYPFHKILFNLLANRINYRNHRKIIVVDGKTGFVGGINISDRYINNKPGKLFWRDTHLRIDGPGIYYLQYLFLTDWAFCCPDKFIPADPHFATCDKSSRGSIVQVVGSGPDSEQPSVLFSLLQAIYLAKEEILITTPYFIPGSSILDALSIAAISGLKVKLLVPGYSDSKLVNAASKANYNNLLQAGVEIYRYKKGFIHAKTMVCDRKLSIVGTANMDNRSFEYNFEVNAIVYDPVFSEKLSSVFFDDLQHAEKIDPEAWFNRSIWKRLPENLARLLSPSL